MCRGRELRASQQGVANLCQREAHKMAGHRATRHRTPPGPKHRERRKQFRIYGQRQGRAHMQSSRPQQRALDWAAFAAHDAAEPARPQQLQQASAGARAPSTVHRKRYRHSTVKREGGKQHAQAGRGCSRRGPPGNLGAACGQGTSSGQGGHRSHLSPQWRQHARLRAQTKQLAAVPAVQKHAQQLYCGAGQAQVGTALGA